jgi:acetoacetyl-CoA synthetase
MSEGRLLWTPSPERAGRTNLADFMRRVGVSTYADLWKWSTDDISAFWSALWDHFDILSSQPYEQVVRGGMTAPVWFEGSRVNYAEHLLRHESRARPDEVALLYCSEDSAPQAITWPELGSRVRKLATHLRKLGIQPGDRIVSYMPNIPETAVAMMACVAVGAVWSSAAPEFGARTVIDRFAQIEPVLMFVSDSYTFGGRTFDRTTEAQQIISALPTLSHVIRLPDLAVIDDVPAAGFEFTRVAWDHPLWVLFSSGTTGLPKAIVHGHAGMLLEHLKVVQLHFDLRPGSRLFFYTTTGWMMWNVVVAALLAGATAVLYDGSPVHPSPDLLWRLAADTKATHMGASPTFLTAQKAANIRPVDRYDLSALQMITLSGSPCSPELFEWILDAVAPDVWIASQSGGTEICSAFVGAVPTEPVYAGEIQARMLGMDVHAWSDDGREQVDAVGELVVTQPFPSMPLRFWNDPDRARYLGTYFQTFPEVWCHGDFVKINERGGCYVYGRSDSTLNRHGVRIGTAEIYRIVEQIPGVADSLVVCCELPDGSHFMPLFIRLAPGAALDEKALRDRLRRDGSPRHVPDAIQAVHAIPYTLTGKKMEIPVRRILQGRAVDSVASRDAMANANALDEYVGYRVLLLEGQGIDR